VLTLPKPKTRRLARKIDAVMHRRIEEASIRPHRQRPFLSLVIGGAWPRSQCKLAQSLVQKIVGFVQKITCLKKSTVISVRVFCRCNRRNQLRNRLQMGQVSRWPIGRWRCSATQSERSLGYRWRRRALPAGCCRALRSGILRRRGEVSTFESMTHGQVIPKII
jgi:hypothetical protein